MTDPTYPQYHVVCRHYDKKRDIYDVVTTTLMKRTPIPEGDWQDMASEWFHGWAAQPERSVELVSSEVTFQGEAMWCLGWFAHWTFAIEGWNDAQYREAFRRYVCKHARYQDFGPAWWAEHPEARCLMGAEDEWRWKGPCRCKHCKAQGVVRIDH